MSHRRCVAWAPRFAVTALYLAVHAGCTTVDGGAVELSWRLTPAAGAGPSQPFVDCDSGLPGTGPVTGIRLDWREGLESGSVVFDCNAGHGVTRFEVPTGRTLLSVSPVCASGPADTTTYMAPAPVERDVTVGNIVSLGAVEVVLTVSSCDLQACICH
jgi:hypothetical protein